MNDTTTVAPPLSLSSRRGIDDALAAWRGLASEQIVGAALLAVAVVAPQLYTLVDRSIASGYGVGTLWPTALKILLAALINAYCLLLAVVLADRAVDRGAARLRAYATAVALGVLAGTAVGWLVNTFMLGSILPPGGMVADKLRINPRAVFTIGISVWLEWVTIGALATFVYADRREIRRIAANLKTAQDNRLAQVRRQLEAELKAIQARVEPQFLFDTLGHMQGLYETNPADAERMMESLIAFLRTAMPEVRATTSTVEREIDLAFAYLTIQSIRFAKPVSYAADLPDELRYASMPPMTLLPLLDQAMAQQRNGEDEPAAVRIEAAAHAGQLQLKICVRGCRSVLKKDPESMTVLRERLFALYDTDAEITLSRANGRATEALMQIPYEGVDGVIADARRAVRLLADQSLHEGTQAS